MQFLKLPERTTGKRTYGLTSIIDLGLPIEHLSSILQDYGEFIDFAKFGIGTAYITPNLAEKVQLYKDFNVIPYFGGTLFEKCYYQNKMIDLVAFLRANDIEWIEISCGTIDISLKERMEVIQSLKSEFNILAEVGSKDPAKTLTTNDWINEINSLLEAGSQYCITEGRDSGTAGIYDSNGQVRTDVIQELVNKLNINQIIFEAPTAKQQMFFINQFGANVNIGNVKPQDVLVLEAERCGLRSETFFLEDNNASHSYSSFTNEMESRT